MNFSENCTKLIQHYEGCKLSAYKDIKGIPTIGYGNTFYTDGTKVSMGDTITIEQAKQLLILTLTYFEKQVFKLVKVPLAQCEFDALVSFTYNVGVSALKTSTLLKLLNEGKNKNVVASEFQKWGWAGGKKIKGLMNRRMSEAYMFSTGQFKAFN